MVTSVTIGVRSRAATLPSRAASWRKTTDSAMLGSPAAWIIRRTIGHSSAPKRCAADLGFDDAEALREDVASRRTGGNMLVGTRSLGGSSR